MQLAHECKILLALIPSPFLQKKFQKRLKNYFFTVLI